MAIENNLQRFIDAQATDFEVALSEVRNGRKQSHWMWYIFPQIQGLGFSSMSAFYAIKDSDEARAYLQHPVLGSRLIEISNALMALKTNDAHKIFGSPDDLKLKSSMTLFSIVDHSDPVFDSVLKKFFEGTKDAKTMQIIGKR